MLPVGGGPQEYTCREKERNMASPGGFRLSHLGRSNNSILSGVPQGCLSAPGSNSPGQSAKEMMLYEQCPFWFMDIFTSPPANRYSRSKGLGNLEGALCARGKLTVSMTVKNQCSKCKPGGLQIPSDDHACLQESAVPTRLQLSPVQ